MEDIKSNIASNIAELRIMSGMTQIELAEKLNYSDKAVSKWERGESVPDVTVLCRIAQQFGVTLDYLVQKEHEDTKSHTVEMDDIPLTRRQKLTQKPVYNPTLNHYLIMGISIFAVILLATVIYLTIIGIFPDSKICWLSFVYAVPASLIIWLVFNSVWFNPRLNFLIVSLLIWSLLAVIYITVLVAGYNIPLIFTIGAPAQIIIFMWSRISHNPNK